MTKYIDADALLENLKKQYGEDLGWQCTVNMSDVGMMIEDAPTADVEEVIRCQNCENKAGEVNRCGDVYCSLHQGWFDKEAFCSYGERVNYESSKTVGK